MWYHGCAVFFVFLSFLVGVDAIGPAAGEAGVGAPDAADLGVAPVVGEAVLGEAVGEAAGAVDAGGLAAQEGVAGGDEALDGARGVAPADAQAGDGGVVGEEAAGADGLELGEGAVGGGVAEEKVEAVGCARALAAEAARDAQQGRVAAVDGDAQLGAAAEHELALYDVGLAPAGVVLAEQDVPRGGIGREPALAEGYYSTHGCVGFCLRFF